MTKMTMLPLLLPAVVACGSARSTEDSVPLSDRACSIVLDEPISAISYDVSLGQTATGEVIVHENGRLHVRTSSGWTEEDAIPVGTSDSQLAVSPSGIQAILADNYTEMVLWARAPGEPWKRLWVFDEHDAVGDRGLAFADDETLLVTVRRRYYEPELYRLRLPTLEMEELRAGGDSATLTLWVESPSAWWWAYWDEGAVVHHGERMARLAPGESSPGRLALTSARGLGVLAWQELAAYESGSGTWTKPRPVAPSRQTECPEHESRDDTHEGERCAIDDDVFQVMHVGGDALDLIGIEATEIGSAEWTCNLEQHGGSCNWSRDVDQRRYLVSGRRDGSFERISELGPKSWYLEVTERGRDGDVHAVLGLHTNDEKAARYVRLACRDRT